MRIFGHVDCNSFFASCEKVFHPEWKNRPVVVLSNNDGCIVARSSEAKELGIPMGVPLFQVRSFAQAKGVVICSGNFSLYGNMSHRVMQTLEQWTDTLEIYSIDEAFLDLTGYFLPKLRKYQLQGIEFPPNLENCFLPEALPVEIQNMLRKLAEEIVEIVPKWTGIPVSFGLGTTKTLAKVANRIAKKKPGHYSILMDEPERIRQLQSVELADVWGIGRHLLPKMQRLGFRNANDLANIDPLYMRRNFSVVQEKLVRELRGEACLDLEQDVPQRQNIQVSRSFGTSLTELEELEKAVSTFSARAAEKVRQQKSVASAVHIQLYTNRHRTDQRQYFPAIAAGFPLPTASTPEIIALALKLTRKIFKEGYVYKKAAVLLMNLVDAEHAAAQPTLFPLDTEKTDEQREREKKLMTALDAINGSLGKGTVFFGSEGIERQWTPAANYQSPCFTTRWEDIPEAE